VLNRIEDISQAYADTLLESGGGLLLAEDFRRVLYLERKRRERSGRPMNLLLVGVRDLPEDHLVAVVRRLTRQLAPLMRETDIKGWYTEGEVIGVLFTEFNDFDKEKMIRKIKSGLQKGIPQTFGERMTYSFLEYPHPKGQGQDEIAANPSLYSEARSKYAARKMSFLFKRMMDIAGSIVGLILFSPLFLLIPALVKLSSPGPVLFRQERVGLNGKLFTFLKFRTMYVNNDAKVHQEYVKKLIAGEVDDKNGSSGGNGDQADRGERRPVFKIQNDSRITPIGHVLRKTSMDELPQFINVLLGDMSLIGPRPPIPYEVQNYDCWHLSRILEVKPGITGLWQVMGRSSTTFDEMVRLDIRYSREWTLWLDIKILCKTPWAVVRGKGAF
jgi:exopolysaccharide biosynthesis polyprenyl glycosylphosphotransferase